MYAEALGCLLHHGGGFDVIACQTHMGGAVRDLLQQNVQCVFLLTQDMLDPVNAAVFEKNATGANTKLVLLANRPDVGFDTSTFDAVVTTWMGTGALFSAIRSAGGNETVSMDLATRPSFPPIVHRLTSREREAGSHMIKGLPNREIAQIMGVSEQSVKNYLRALMLKLNCRNRVALGLALAKMAESDGMIRDPHA
jgi:DNA-binding CsgD family transcriptional regulator